MHLINSLSKVLRLTNYKISTPKITLGAIIAINLLTSANLLAELLIDLETTTLEVMATFWVLGLILLTVFRFRPSSTILPGLVTLFLYSLLELMFISNPKSFHAIHFWLMLTPLVALIIQGMRSSIAWVIIILITFFFNTFWIENQLNGEYVMLVRKDAYLITHLIYFSGLLSSSFLLYKLLGDAYIKMKEKSEELLVLQHNIQMKKNLLEQYQNSLLEINRNEILFKNDLQEIYKVICSTAVKNLNVNRVGIWLMENRNTVLVRKYLLDNNKSTDEMINITRWTHPTYFKALESKALIMADHASTHEDTLEFTESYLKPLNILSLLDCPIKINRDTIGVICCENQGEIKIWEPEEALYVQSLADILSMIYQNERIKQLLRQIRNQNHELVGKTKAIETMNEELTSLNEELVSLNDQLSKMNEGLEEAVKKRTAELEIQNKQLTEYAFINSHLLRAPLARILGLAQLILMETTLDKDQKLLYALQLSTHELDSIIRKISELLYDGNQISREDIKTIISKNFSQVKPE